MENSKNLIPDVQLLATNSFCMMNKTTLVLSFILLPFTLLSQALTQDDITGKWIAKNSALIGDMSEMKLDNEGKKKMEKMTESLLFAEFTFNSDMTFEISFQDTIPDFMKEISFLDNKLWKFDSEQSLISIGEHDEKEYNLMGIYVKVEDGTTLFILDETPFVLLMKKK